MNIHPATPGVAARYTVESLGEVAELFDERARTAELVAKSTAHGSRKNRTAGTQAQVWREAASVLRATTIEAPPLIVMNGRRYGKTFSAIVESAKSAVSAYVSRFGTGTGNFVGPIDEEMLLLQSLLDAKE